MPDLNDIYSQLPAETQKSLGSVWSGLSPAEQENLRKLLTAMPGDPNLLKMLIDLSINQFRLAFGKKSRIVIAGPTNVGKSTLYNQFVRARQDQAAVSPLPGTTRINQLADAGLFTIIDTPGADAVGQVGEQEKQHAMDAAAEADFLIIMFDAIQGIKRDERELFEELTELKKPYIVVLNKIDLVKRESKQVVLSAAINLGLQPEQVIPIAAMQRKNLDQLLAAIALAEPGIVAAMGQALPQFRWQLSWRAIVGAASVSAAIALAPLPFVDFAPLLINQSAMVLAIARIYNYNITLERARELIATFGLGMLGRTLFQELSKLGGLPGWLLSAAVASSTTVAMGIAAARWFESGERITNESLGRITRSMTDYLLARLKGSKKKLSQQDMQHAVEEALKDVPEAPKG
jgi:small GTP-binding protein